MEKIRGWSLVGINFVVVVTFLGKFMKRKERYIVNLDEVIETRGIDYADIEYKEPGIASTRLQIGPETSRMSDQEIVDLFNEMLRAQARFAAEYKHVAVEVPLGSRQIEYSADCHQWSPRGGVPRRQTEDDENGQLVGFGRSRAFTIATKRKE